MNEEQEEKVTEMEDLIQLGRLFSHSFFMLMRRNGERRREENERERVRNVCVKERNTVRENEKRRER